MIIILVILAIIVSILLGAVVLVQNPKGGGLTAGAVGSVGNNILGARRSTDFIEKLTWYLVVILMVICLFSGRFAGSATQGPVEQDMDGLEQRILENPSNMPTQPQPGTPQ
jgi:preprotein translocase subunit SecG